MAYRWALQGAVLPNSFKVKPRSASGDLVRLAVSTSSLMTSPVYYGPDVADTYGFSEIDAIGLLPRTTYYWQVEINGVLAGPVGKCRTFPAIGQPCASFTIASVSCSGNPNAVNTSANARALAAIEARDPDLFVHLGDIHYTNPETMDPLEHISGWSDALELCPRYASLLSKVPLAHIWSDHEYSGKKGNTGKDVANRDVACTIRRTIVPDYPLIPPPGPYPGGGIYYRYRIGRVHVVASDLRAYRDPDGMPQSPDKTMLGVEQKAWLKEAFRVAVLNAPVVVWMQETNFITPTEAAGPFPVEGTAAADRWASFNDERLELVRSWRDNGVPGVVVLEGDQHFAGLKTNHRQLPDGPPMFLIHSSKLETPSTVPPTQGKERWEVGPGLDQGYYCFTTISDDGTDVTVSSSLYHVDSVTGVESLVGSRSQVFSPLTTTPPTGTVLDVKHGATLVSSPVLRTKHTTSLNPATFA